VEGSWGRLLLRSYALGWDIVAPSALRVVVVQARKLLFRSFRWPIGCKSPPVSRDAGAVKERRPALKAGREFCWFYCMRGVKLSAGMTPSALAPTRECQAEHALIDSRVVVSRVRIRHVPVEVFDSYGGIGPIEQFNARSKREQKVELRGIVDWEVAG
jgi:hypothetical protein